MVEYEDGSGQMPVAILVVNIPMTYNFIFF